jgi:hypothetical protein
MKYLKRFNESNLHDISPDDIDDYLIDFIQLGFKTDIGVGSSLILDFDKSRNNGEKYILSHSVDTYSKGIAKKTISIRLKSTKLSEYDISELEEGYHMLSSYLKSEWNLVPNYIMLNTTLVNTTRQLSNSITRTYYFENFEAIRDVSNMENTPWDPGKFYSKDITFGFYRLEDYWGMIRK